MDGSIVTHREFVSRLVGTTEHRALMVGYRLAPEHPFPAALEDVLSVYDAMVTSRQLDPARIVLGGDSSGAGLAISAMMRLASEKRDLPICGFTISGVFDMTLSSESMISRNDMDPCLSHEALVAWTRYFEDCDLSDASISPIFGDPRGLPPMLMQVGDHEVWLDDSRRMKEKIEASGGRAELRIWDSMWHVWHMNPELPEACSAISEIGHFIDDILESDTNKPLDTMSSNVAGRSTPTRDPRPATRADPRIAPQRCERKKTHLTDRCSKCRSVRLRIWRKQSKRPYADS